MPYCREIEKASHDIEATATDDSEKANREITSKSIPVPKTIEDEKERQRGETVNEVMGDRERATVIQRQK